MRTFYAGAAVLVIAALVAAPFVWTRLNAPSDRFAACRQGAVAGGSGAIGDDFTLVSETGETVTSAELLTEPAILYFGYTFCPDVCPLDAARNALAVDLLAAEGYRVTPVFITIDPARDTPAVLADYTDRLHPRMIGLTGSEAQVQAASQAYRTYYSRQGTPEEDPYYLVDHSTFSYLVLPGHGFVEYFRRDADAEEMAQRVGCFLKAA
jgi:protein SCO1/2